jgi:hypothetical protein
MDMEFNAKPEVDIFNTGGGVALTNRRRDRQTDKPLPLADFPPTGKMR